MFSVLKKSESETFLPGKKGIRRSGLKWKRDLSSQSEFGGGMRHRLRPEFLAFVPEKESLRLFCLF